MNKVVAIKFMTGDMIAELVESVGPNAQYIKVRGARWIVYVPHKTEAGRADTSLPEFFFIPAGLGEITINLGMAITRPVEVGENWLRLYEAVNSKIALPEQRGIIVESTKRMQ